MGDDWAFYMKNEVLFAVFIKGLESCPCPVAVICDMAVFRVEGITCSELETFS